MGNHWTILPLYGKILSNKDLKRAKRKQAGLSDKIGRNQGRAEAKMYELFITDPTLVENAIKNGKKLVLCSVGEDELPKTPFTEVGFIPLPPEKKQNAHVQRAKEYIENNFNKNVRLDDLAAYCDLSPTHLSRLFSGCTGVTVSEYVLSCRMRRAADLLKTTSDTVVSIAREVGCVDCGYFNKRFRMYYGVTPLNYRKSFSISVK